MITPSAQLMMDQQMEVGHRSIAVKCSDLLLNYRGHDEPREEPAAASHSRSQGARCARRGTKSLYTLRWREMDSNLQSRKDGPSIEASHKLRAHTRERAPAATQARGAPDRRFHFAGWLLSFFCDSWLFAISIISFIILDWNLTE